MEQNAISVQNLRKSFLVGFWRKPKTVLNDLSFNVKSGVTTGFIGVNGSGKTTTFKSILNFIIPDSGQVSFFGEKDFNNKVRSQIGFLPERPYLPEFLTLKEFLRFHWDLAGVSSDLNINSDHHVDSVLFERRCEEALKKVNLERAKDTKLKQFSKGMLQRAGIAQALIHQPKLLIFDEPMSGLDPDGRFMVKEIIREQKKLGTSILFSTHLLSDVEELCDDLIVIDQGQLLFQGALESFIKNVKESYRIFYQLHAEDRSLLCGQSEINGKIQELLNQGAKIQKVDSEHGVVESAFQQLRANNPNQGKQL